MNFTNPVDFERSGMINLGDLSLDPKESTLPDDPGQEEEPEEGVVYFAPTSDWTAGGAHVAAYFWLISFLRASRVRSTSRRTSSASSLVG